MPPGIGQSGIDSAIGQTHWSPASFGHPVRTRRPLNVYCETRHSTRRSMVLCGLRRSRSPPGTRCRTGFSTWTPSQTAPNGGEPNIGSPRWSNLGLPPATNAFGVKCGAVREGLPKSAGSGGGLGGPIATARLLAYSRIEGGPISGPTRKRRSVIRTPLSPSVPTMRRVGIEPTT